MANSRDDVPVTAAVLSQALQILRHYPIFVIFSIFISRFLFRKYVSPIRKYPGPFLASGSRAWKVYSTYKGHTEDDHIALHAKYGPIVRIAPNELSFSSPEAAREILSPGKGFHKTDFYSVFPPPSNPDIFTETREYVHAQKKRVVATPYNLASFQALTPWIEQTERVLISRINEFAASRQVFNLGDYLHYFAFDVLGEVAFSKAFGFLEQGKDVDGAIKFIDQVQTYDGIVGQVPWWDYFLRRNPLAPYLPVEHYSKNLITRIALGQMEARQSGNEKADRKDLLSNLLDAHAKDPEKFSEGDVFAVTHGAVFAGSDSTASTMQTFMWNVLAHKEVYDRLSAEIDGAEKNGVLSDMVSWEEAQKDLPYFQACLKEAMRVGPAVGLNITRYVPPSGATIEGTALPGGTRVAVNAWVTHLDKNIFGADSDKFRPERWLTSKGMSDKDDEARIKRMDRYMFQFGGGSHVCLGRNLALLEMNKVLPEILRRYNFKLVHEGRPLKKHSSFFVVQEGLEVYVELK